MWSVSLQNSDGVTLLRCKDSTLSVAGISQNMRECEIYSGTESGTWIGFCSSGVCACTSCSTGQGQTPQSGIHSHHCEWVETPKGKAVSFLKRETDILSCQWPVVPGKVGKWPIWTGPGVTYINRLRTLFRNFCNKISYFLSGVSLSLKSCDPSSFPFSTELISNTFLCHISSSKATLMRNPIQGHHPILWHSSGNCCVKSDYASLTSWFIAFIVTSCMEASTLVF